MPGTFLVHGQGKKIAKGTDAALGQADGAPAFTHLQAGKMHARACVFKAFGGLKPGQIAQGQAFRLDDWQLFLACTAVTMVAFALIYAFVYKMTAKVYYRLVKNEVRS